MFSRILIKFFSLKEKAQLKIIGVLIFLIILIFILGIWHEDSQSNILFIPSLLLR